MSGIRDLRDFLEILKENKLLFEVEKEVDWNHEIGSLLATMEAEGQKTGLFHKVKDKGFPVCGNVLASMDGIALALGCKKNEMTAPATRPVKTTIVESRSVIRKDFSGIVEAVEYVKLAFRVSGQIISLPVIEGEKVKKGAN